MDERVEGMEDGRAGEMGRWLDGWRDGCRDRWRDGRRREE